MKTKPDSIWNRLIKRLLPADYHERPAPDLDQNSSTLARLQENDPVYRAVMDHAFVQFANALNEVLDPTQPRDKRVSAADSAIGLRQFIEDIEYRRAGWNEERVKQLRAEAAARRPKETSQ
jgi:hypothetical protein